MLHRNDKAHECQVGKGKADALRPLSLSPKPMNYDFVISTDPPAKAKRRAGREKSLCKNLLKNSKYGTKWHFFR